MLKDWASYLTTLPRGDINYPCTAYVVGTNHIENL